MNVTRLEIPELLLIQPRVFEDARGRFFETWTERRYAEAGIPGPFVQDNVSMSGRGVIRGLHYQEPHPQAKLVTALEGEVWDVAVDVRVGSSTFGRWCGVTLSAEEGTQIYIPEGFAHGLAVLSERAIVSYKCGDYYHPEAERTIRWDDPDIGIEWPIEEPVLSEKDRKGRSLGTSSSDAARLRIATER